MSDKITKSSAIMFNPAQPYGDSNQYPAVLTSKLAQLRFEVVREMKPGKVYRIDEYFSPLGQSGPGGGIKVTVEAVPEEFEVYK